ncbi:MAG: hypothetical protein P857_360 [Candidatus Xenolissoclinum pacificiensis L6]|uniref:Uncharacterized protein n=1 Tax=Candidatus Xenolissoclinum pacificiensis L6 TaxID=1401685 RepID=W2V004_9RICK|nr:MAG: hypothetical protein P857_360 [Candidatus Xenolissoclinum pacificiensis L6]
MFLVMQKVPYGLCAVEGIRYLWLESDGAWVGDQDAKKYNKYTYCDNNYCYKEYTDEFLSIFSPNGIVSYHLLLDSAHEKYVSHYLYLDMYNYCQDNYYTMMDVYADGEVIERSIRIDDYDINHALEQSAEYIEYYVYDYEYDSFLANVASAMFGVTLGCVITSLLFD